MRLQLPLPLDRLETFAEGLDHAEGICQTLDGALYVGGEAGQLYRVEPDGRPTELLRTDGFLLGLAADAAGHVYAIDAVHRCVWRIDPASGERTMFARDPGIDREWTPNHGAFGPDGSYWVSDNGGWGAHEGRIWRVPPGGAIELWTEASRGYPNGLAVSPDGTRLYVLESLPGALATIDVLPDGAAGERRLLCDMDPAVPDGLALAEDGSILIACYRPDAIFHWSADDGLRVLAEDPRGAVLAAPTNIVLTGPARDEIVVPNIGRWHLTRMPAGVVGVPLHYPTPDQLGA